LKTRSNVTLGQRSQTRSRRATLGQRVNKLLICFAVRRKQDVKAVSIEVQVSPLLDQRHNAALGLFISLDLALGAL